jgi:hypothetical protein
MTFESFIVESGARHRLWILPEAWMSPNTEKRPLGNG